MPEKWTGRLRGHMFNENVSVRELAEAASWSFGYVSAILHGKRIRPGAREVLEGAYEEILKRRKEERKKHLRERDEGADQRSVDQSRQPTNQHWENYNTRTIPKRYCLYTVEAEDLQRGRQLKKATCCHSK